jgi:hypothetical protein
MRLGPGKTVTKDEKENDRNIVGKQRMAACSGVEHRELRYMREQSQEHSIRCIVMPTQVSAAPSPPI